jgi:hypothetical protein
MTDNLYNRVLTVGLIGSKISKEDKEPKVDLVINTSHYAAHCHINI